MKRITLLILTVLLFALVTNAQITKGSIYLGGSIGASNAKGEVSTSTELGKRKSISISPSVGVAVKDNLIAGVNFYYFNNSSKKFYSYGDYKSTTWGAGLFARKYVPMVRRLYFFEQTNLNYNRYRYEDPASVNDPYFSKTEQKTIAASLYPGLAFNVFKSFYIETTFPALVSIGYNQSTSTSNTYGSTVTTKENGAFFTTELSNSNYLNFGVRFIIPKK